MKFGVGQLQFIDSPQFLKDSLHNLSNNLQTEDLLVTTVHSAEKNLSLLRRKGVYPYEYIDGYHRFDERPLPPKETIASLPVKVLVLIS